MNFQCHAVVAYTSSYSARLWIFPPSPIWSTNNIFTMRAGHDKRRTICLTWPKDLIYVSLLCTIGGTGRAFRIAVWKIWRRDITAFTIPWQRLVESVFGLLLNHHQTIDILSPLWLDEVASRNYLLTGLQPPPNLQSSPHQAAVFVLHIYTSLLC